MKKLTTMVLFLLIFMGCANLSTSGTATHEALAYAAGVGMSTAINKLSPAVDELLTLAWEEMMERNIGKPEISREEMILFYNNCFSLTTSSVDGWEWQPMINHLSFFLTVFAAEFSTDQQLINIQPVPLHTMQAFEIGYANQKVVMEKWIN